jgi:DNA-binding transcriptional MerR regulator
VADDPRYAIGDLADLGGVSRRTVRYYVQEGLLPDPYGLGRGNHYGPEHLNQLLKVKSLQEAGRTLEEIRHSLNHKHRGREPRAPEPPLERTMWRRITLSPGVELNVAGDVRLPSPGKLTELAAWCRRHFPANPGEEDHDA